MELANNQTGNIREVNSLKLVVVAMLQGKGNMKMRN